jgi:hypothetical protein
MPLAGPEYFRSHDDDHTQPAPDSHRPTEPEEYPHHEQDAGPEFGFADEQARRFNNDISYYWVPRLDDLHAMDDLLRGTEPTRDDPSVSETWDGELIDSEVADEATQNANPYNWLIEGEQEIFLNAQARHAQSADDLTISNRHRFVQYAQTTDPDGRKSIFEVFEDYQRGEWERSDLDNAIRDDLDLDPRPDDEDVLAPQPERYDRDLAEEIPVQKRLARVRRDPNGPAQPRAPLSPAPLLPAPSVPQPAPYHRRQPSGGDVPVPPPAPRSRTVPSRRSILPGAGPRETRGAAPRRVSDHLGRSAVRNANPRTYTDLEDD